MGLFNQSTEKKREKLIRREAKEISKELAALGMTYAEYFEKLEKLCIKIYNNDLPEPKSNWVYPF